MMFKESFFSPNVCFKVTDRNGGITKGCAKQDDEVIRGRRVLRGGAVKGVIPQPETQGGVKGVILPPEPLWG